jgi:hypothetical protein
VRYVESQFERTQSIISNTEGDLIPLLSGAGTPQVDIVLYVILHSLSPPFDLYPGIKLTLCRTQTRGH